MASTDTNSKQDSNRRLQRALAVFACKQEDEIGSGDALQLPVGRVHPLTDETVRRKTNQD
jgi:hypothetical protein